MSRSPSHTSSHQADQALSLTVHSQPAASAMAQTAEAQTRRGRINMLLLLAVCIAPVAASYFSYYVWRPSSMRNYGELIQPPRALPQVTALTAEGTSKALPSLQGQWLLMSVGSGLCPKTCEAHLYLQRQLRETLGKEKDRLDWVWLIDDEAPLSTALQPALQSAQVLRVKAADLHAWLQAAKGQALADHLYLVDPMGNWMMRFPADADTSKIKRDIERLMRASASWDRPGREAEIIRLDEATRASSPGTASSSTSSPSSNATPQLLGSEGQSK
jgi:hypothetical protein